MNFQLILISAPGAVEEERNKLLQLLENGLSTFHIRKPDWDQTTLQEYMLVIPKKYHGRLVLHSHYPLALQYDLKGIHLTEKAKKDKTAITLLQKLAAKSVSASFHSAEEVARHRRQYAYVFLSPVFDSISKADYKSNFSLEAISKHLQQWQQRKDYVPRVIALGGINADNINLVRQAGFSGAALLGTIWQHPDPASAFRAIQSKIR